ncbi:AAA family ATPase [Catenovulum adriaticum]|uniref:ATP-binding protein n=1 Tax=Catenovulum adriaticum TaxID=2984846 RepID=A0ABY7AJM6_9ALTE|nr:ATP-binding protein [Catenovulum sp. TS8]WAJ69540.1 ATP-binding protein [Catenovulum sp. TS8]
MLHFDYEPSKLHGIACLYMKKVLPYVLKPSDEIESNCIASIRGKQIKHRTQLNLKQSIASLNTVEKNTKAVSIIQHNAQYICQFLNLRDDAIPIFEFLIVSNLNTGIKNLLASAYYSVNLQIEGLLCKVFNVPPVLIRTLVRRCKVSGLTWGDELEEDYIIELPDFLLDSIDQRKYQSDLDLVGNILFECSPPQFKTSQFPHVNVDLVSRYLEKALEQKVSGVNLLFYGESGTGKTELAKSLARYTGKKLYEIRSPNIDYGTKSKYEFNTSENKSSTKRLQYLLFIEMVLKNSPDCILLFDECENVFDSVDQNYSKDLIHRLLEELSLPCIWITNYIGYFDPSCIRRFKLTIDFPTLSPSMIYDISRYLYKGLDVSKPFIQSISKVKNVTPAYITNAIHIAKTIGAKRDEAELIIDDAIRAKLVATGLHEIEYKYQTAITFNPNYLNVDADKVTIDMIKNAVSDNKSIRVLLNGAPGTGKTALVHHLFDSHNNEFISIKTSDILGKYVGESEQNVARIFKRATEEQAGIFIDEIDSLLSAREHATALHERQLVNELLVQIEAFRYPLFAATNFDNALDKAVMRRFDFKFRCLYLKPEQSIGLLKEVLNTSKIPKAVKTELEELTHLTAGDFSIIARQAQFRTTKLTAHNVLTLLKQEHYRKIPKPSIGFLQS